MADGDKTGKKIPKSVIFKHFLSLPEEQRVKLLQSHIVLPVGEHADPKHQQKEKSHRRRL